MLFYRGTKSISFRSIDFVPHTHTTQRDEKGLRSRQINYVDISITKDDFINSKL